MFYTLQKSYEYIHHAIFYIQLAFELIIKCLCSEIPCAAIIWASLSFPFVFVNMIYYCLHGMHDNTLLQLPDKGRQVKESIWQAASPPPV